MSVPAHELSRFLDSFKVVELQELLGTLGVSKLGKKLELKQRAQTLLLASVAPPPVLEAKIVEIYVRKNPHWAPEERMNGGGGRTVVTNGAGRFGDGDFLRLFQDLTGATTSAASSNHARSAHLNHAIFSGNDALRRVVASQPPAPAHAASTMGGARTVNAQVRTPSHRSPSVAFPRTFAHNQQPLLLEAPKGLAFDLDLIERVSAEYLLQTPVVRRGRNAGLQRGVGGGLMTPSLLGNNGAAKGAAAPTPPVRNPTNLSIVRLPFFDVLEVLIPPTALLPRTSTEMQDHYGAIDIHKSKAHRFVKDLNTHSIDSPLPRTELQLRFFKYDTAEAQKEDFPSKAVVRLDKTIVQLPAVIPTNKPGVEAKRPSRPVDITSYCYQHLASPRAPPLKLNVTWSQAPQKPFYVYTVEVVRRLSTDILVSRLRNKGPRPSGQMKKMVADKLSGDSDADLCVDSLRVSLLCPLGMMRMKLPGKARGCTHPACFDLFNFLCMNEKKPTWTCPCCHKSAHFDDLLIEGYFMEIMEDPRTVGMVEVELYKDGSFRGISEEEKDSKGKSGVTAAVSASTSSSIRPSAASSNPASTTKGKAAPVTAPVTATIDDDDNDIILLSDSDDEEPPAPIKAPPTAPSCSRNFGGDESPPDSPSIIVLDSPSPTLRPPSPSSRGTFRRDRPSPPLSKSPPKKRAALSSTSSASPRPASNATLNGSSGPPTPSVYGAAFAASSAAPFTSQSNAAFASSSPAFSAQATPGSYYQQMAAAANYAAAGYPYPFGLLQAPSPQPPPAPAPPDQLWNDPNVDPEFQRFLSMCQANQG